MHQGCYRIVERFVGKNLVAAVYKEILEVGSKDVNGSVRPIFSKHNHHYTGLDITPGPGVDFITASPYHFIDEQGYWLVPEFYDVVVCANVLEHVEDKEKLLQEIVRVMAHGALICITVPWTIPIHKDPVNDGTNKDCWRIAPDGMIWLAGRVGLVTLECALDPTSEASDMYFYGRKP